MCDPFVIASSGAGISVKTVVFSYTKNRITAMQRSLHVPGFRECVALSNCISLNA